MGSVDKTGIGDSVTATLGSLISKPFRPWARTDKVRVRGNVHTVLRDELGAVKYEEWGDNMVTDYGDDMIATRMFDDAVNIVTGMKLGSGATAVVKATVATHDLDAYIDTSNEALDGVATDATKGAGLGWRTTYVCTWVAGDITHAAIVEVVLTNQTALANDAGTAGDIVARYVFGATIDKQAGDSLVVTWDIDVLGA